MPHRDTKLHRFEEAIMKRANQERQRILKEIETMQASEVKIAEESALRDEARRVKGELAEIGEDSNRELSLKTAEFRQTVLKRRDEMTAAVFAEARAQLMTFASSGEPYTDWLLGRVDEMKSLYPSEGTLLYIMARDLPLAGQLCARYGGSCTAAVSEDFEIGGLILFHPATGLIVDESLDSALKDQRDYFLEHSGLTGL